MNYAQKPIVYIGGERPLRNSRARQIERTKLGEISVCLKCLNLTYSCVIGWTYI